MSFRVSGWGISKFGGGIWGWSGLGFSLAGAILPTPTGQDSIFDIINCSDSKPQNITATVELDSVDVSAYCTGWTITTPSNGGRCVCSVSFSNAGSISCTARSSELEITITYTVGSDTYSSKRFHGLVYLAETTRQNADDVLDVEAFDLLAPLADTPPQDDYDTSSIDYAGTPIATELVANGYGPHTGTFDDYLGYFPANGSWSADYDSAWALIVALANGRKPTLTVPMPDGTLRLIAYDDPFDQSWTIPLSGQSYQMPASATDGRYNEITITYRNATATPRTVRDTDDIALYGVLPYSGTFTMPGQYSSAATFKTDAEAIATDIFTFSQRQRYRFSTAVNPLIFPGDKVTLTLDAGGTEDVLIEQVIDSWAPDSGFWSEFTGSVI